MMFDLTGWEAMAWVFAFSMLLFAFIAYWFGLKIEKMKECQHHYKMIRICELCGHKQKAVEVKDGLSEN
jgi:hypothetical protein